MHAGAAPRHAESGKSSQGHAPARWVTLLQRDDLYLH
jgi:hypothetical protein